MIISICKTNYSYVYGHRCVQRSLLRLWREFYLFSWWDNKERIRRIQILFQSDVTAHAIIHFQRDWCHPKQATSNGRIDAEVFAQMITVSDVYCEETTISQFAWPRMSPEIDDWNVSSSEWMIINLAGGWTRAPKRTTGNPLEVAVSFVQF